MWFAFTAILCTLPKRREQFIAQIDAALNEAPEDRARKHKREEKILAEQAWDAIADSMETLMQKEWAKTANGKPQVTARRAPASTVSAPSAPSGMSERHGCRIESFRAIVPGGFGFGLIVSLHLGGFETSAASSYSGAAKSATRGGE